MPSPTAIFVAPFLLAAAALAQTNPCAGYTGWNYQGDPPTDSVGFYNLNYPEGSSTSYFGANITQPLGTTYTIQGRYPYARFMAIEIYTGDTLVDFVADVNIVPDPGQNNPFVSGTANGTFTAYVVFGAKPATPAANTIYTGTLTTVGLLYRIYHTTDPNDPSGGAGLPTIVLNGSSLVNCPIQPILPPGSTPWLRLATGDWMGTPPTPAQKYPASNPTTWSIANPDVAHYFPNGADFYLTTRLSRQFLKPIGSADLFVVRFLAPTFPNTRSGVPVYAPRQVRFWSLCTDDSYTTNVNRCVWDDEIPLDANGYVSIVISDPGSMPSAAALSKFKAIWLAWGALDLSTDVVYDRKRQPWGINTPVHYYNDLLYRQTLASPTFTQSMMNISQLPVAQQQQAMGAYWPQYGYCTSANFEAYGVKCLNHN